MQPGAEDVIQDGNEGKSSPKRQRQPIVDRLEPGNPCYKSKIRNRGRPRRLRHWSDRLTLWFETSDVWRWQLPQLTGVQRVVATVLGQLLHSRSDVKPVRFDTGSNHFLPIAPEDLPLVVRKYGELPQTTPAAQMTSLYSQGGRRWKKFPDLDLRPLSILRQRAPENVKSAVDAYRLSRKALRRSVRHWLLPKVNHTPPSSGTDLAKGSPRPVDRSDREAERPQTALFGSGDVFLSMSLTWGRSGYWPAVAFNKRGGAKVIQFLHDIIPVLQPQWALPELSELVTAWFHELAHQADLLLVSSQFQRSEIRGYLERAGLPQPPIEIVRLGDDPPYFKKMRNDVIAASPEHSPAGPFVLCVSGFFQRKNQRALYHVWRRLAVELQDRCPLLVLVGHGPLASGELFDEIRRDPLTRDRVLVLCDVQDEHLANLYQKCLFTVYPSFYEGWGLPVCESLWFGRYCIASSQSSIPEVGGDLVDYFDPMDQAELYRKVMHAIATPDYIREREFAIRERYRPFSWQQTALQVSDWADRLGARASGLPVSRPNIKESHPAPEQLSLLQVDDDPSNPRCPTEKNSRRISRGACELRP